MNATAGRHWRMSLKFDRASSIKNTKSRPNVGREADEGRDATMSRIGTLTAARILDRPDSDRYQDRYRLWQGIPSIERTRGGRLYANWYSGMATETGGNFVVVTSSDDG